MPTSLVELVRAKMGGGFDRSVGAKGEYQGPCPKCGCQSSAPGHVCDRFSIFPDQPPSGEIAVNAGVPGGFWCRNCGLAGDYVQWLVEVEGWDWTKIFEFLGVKGERKESRPKELTPYPVQPVRREGRSLDDLEELQFPSDLWREHADKFARQCAADLEKNQLLIEWLDHRGITLDVAKEFGLGWHAGKPQKNGKPPCSYRSREGWGLPRKEWPGGKPKLLWLPRGLTIPKYRDGKLLGVRIRRPSVDLKATDKKYIQIEGSRHGCMITPGAQAYVVVEAELDKIAVDAAGVEGVAGCAMGSLSSYPDTIAAGYLLNALAVLQSLDFEPQGKGEKYGNKFRAWWIKIFPRCKRAPLPVGKDPGELVGQIGIAGLRAWIESQLPPAMRISLPPPKGKINHAPMPVEGPKWPNVIEELRLILATNQIEIHVGESGKVLGCRGPVEVSDQVGLLCQRPVVQEWLSEIGEETVSIRNFMKPMESI